MSARLIVVALMLCSAPAVACACGWSGYATALKVSGVAFEGVPEGDVFDVPFTLRFGAFVRVTRVFKGTVAPKVFVTSVASSCGHALEPGKPYVFVIYPELDGVFSYETYGCDGTRPLAALAPSDLAIFGSGAPPSPRVAPWLVLGTLIAILLLWLRRARAK